MALGLSIALAAFGSDRPVAATAASAGASNPTPSTSSQPGGVAASAEDGTTCSSRPGPDLCTAVTPVAPVGPPLVEDHDEVEGPVIPATTADPNVSRATSNDTGSVTASDVLAPMCSGTGNDDERVQPVYAYTSASPNPTTLASIPSWAGEADDAYSDSAARTGGSRRVRWVTTTGSAGCTVSVLAVPITRGATDFVSLVAQLRAAGLTNGLRKYLVWTEGNIDNPQSSTCGIGQFYADDSPGPDNANATDGPLFAAVDTRCWNQNGGHSVPSHELMHELGAVQSSAPHFNGDGHCTDDYDAMCYGPTTDVVPSCSDFSVERLFDCNGDDYFNTDPPAGGYVCTHWNTASNPYLYGWNDLAPLRGVTAVRLAPVVGAVTVSWDPSPSCVPPDAYQVTVSPGGGTQVVPAGQGSASFAAPSGTIVATVTPIRSGVAGPGVSASVEVPAPVPPPVPPPVYAPVGQLVLHNVDHRNVAMFGWAVDPNTVAPITVVIGIEGVGYFPVAADRDWDQMDQRYPGYGRNHAFVFSAANIAPGNRSMCAFALDTAGGPSTNLGCFRAVVK